MDHTLSALVQIDLDGAYVRLLVTGCVTEASQPALYPLIRRARALSPPVTVTVDLTVDLTAAEHVEVVGVDLLRWAVDHDKSMGGAGPVKILLPDELPDHPPRRPG
ncbi:hypothetical protein [Kocuria sp.]|uniref:hypothetical protein n=1 Tax=Kocuria sp. TaxID=1871328 RepID=UPI002811BC02|nr:hypothetical protein [Kocuria sp.]